jgi:hypothetical protein
MTLTSALRRIRLDEGYRENARARWRARHARYLYRKGNSITQPDEDGVLDGSFGQNGKSTFNVALADPQMQWLTGAVLQSGRLVAHLAKEAVSPLADRIVSPSSIVSAFGSHLGPLKKQERFNGQARK